MSRWFDDEEFACHCGCGYNEPNPILVYKLDELCDLLGGKVDINCACRCPEHNEEVGGVENSQHVLGNAADVDCPDFDTCSDVDTLAEYAKQVGFDGIGIYYPEDGNFVHMDVRSDGEEPATYLW